MKLSEVMVFLAEHGDERTKATLMKHGAREPFFGGKVADLKKLVKQIKKDLLDKQTSELMECFGQLRK